MRPTSTNGHAVDGVLRHQPEDAHRHGGLGRVQQPARGGHGPAPPLDGRGHRVGQHGEGHADARALEVGDAGGVAGAAAERADEDAVVDGEGEQHGEVGEDEHGRRRDPEARRHVAVHGARLLDREAAVVRPRGHQEDGGRPDRQHAYDRLELLDAVHGRQPPQLWFAGRQHVAARHYGCLVKEPGGHNASA